tara:strand:- start:15488 stop:16135 length:648 start_codon:yes stop_codon:yes gene_type:complete
MSYILEALNKSEQERRGSQTPDLNTIHRPPPTKSATSKPWLAVVLVIGLLNGIALIYWLSSNKSTQPVVTGSEPRPAPTQQIQPKAIPAATTTAPVVAPVVQSTAQSTAQSTVQARPATQVITPTSVPQRPQEPPVRITELPINVQRQIPNLVFSSHLFSNDPGFRMVNINGKMIREGDMVASDLKLLEITEGGVVLGYLHYVFEVSVLRDWSFN